MTNAAFRPTAADVRHVGGLLGLVLLGAAGLHLPAIVVALATREWNGASAMLVAAGLAAVGGTRLARNVVVDRRLSWAEGMVTVALAWLAVPVPVAISFRLSGHAGSAVDAYFDAMSGLTTSGLSVLQDIDHAGAGIQVLRHLTHFAGGQGIVLVMLMLVVAGGPHVGTLLVGEGRDERLLPNAVRTARMIYLIAAAWGVVGTAVLWVVLQVVGFSPWRALLHASALFMAAFDTGGFSIQSTSVGYYHSALVEAVLVVLMVAGALSFPLHLELWRRRFGSALEDLDLRTFAVTTSLLALGAMVALAAHSTYDHPAQVLRKGAFTVVSAATGTGFGVVAPAEYATWGQLAPGLVVTAMAFGAMAGSTAGGIKTVRIGLLAKAVLRDVRASLTAQSAVVRATYHARRDRVVTDEQVAGAVIIMALFVGTYLFGAMVIVWHGGTLEAALFESTSATAAVGLSVGVTSPAAPLAVKVTTILQMWLGRLEFLSAFALVIWVGSAARAQVDRWRRAAT